VVSFTLWLLASLPRKMCPHYSLNVWARSQSVAAIRNPTAIFVGCAARILVTELTELTCSMLVKFEYYFRYRDLDKRIEKRRRKVKRGKGDDGQEDTYAGAFLEYLAKAISYIYRWNNTARMDKDAELAVKKAAIQILEMDERLTEVMEFWYGH